MDNEDEWFEKFIEAGLLKRESDTVVRETELGRRWFEFVNKYSEPDE